MTQRQLNSAAVLLGIPLTVLALWLQPRVAAASLDMMTRGGALAFAAAAATKVIFQLVVIVPGLLIGLLAQTRSIPLAATAGLIGALVYSVALGTALQTPPHPYLPNPWSWVIGDVLAQTLISGLAGGAGHLLRNGARGAQLNR